jgi:DNA-binding transcriptional MerR regulator/methylmalonyl-CoA mutase cobalamin-binding subunit
MATDEPDQPALYPIRTVSNLTGVNAVTLRAWERRYGLIRPHRTAKGHRLYTQGDVAMIQEVVDLLGTGVSIGQVKGQVGRGRASLPSAGAEQEGDAWRTYQQRMLLAVERFDEPGHEAAYGEALALYPVDVVTERLVNPLLRSLGERWQGRRGGIAEEHFFATYLRNKLGARLHHLATQRARTRLLAACLPGEHHELGLLLFCLAAANHGYGFVILGADTPLDEIAHAQQQARCAGIVLSGSVSPTAAVLDGLRLLAERVGVPVLVGGQVAWRHEASIRATGATPLGADLPVVLRRLPHLLEAAQ